MKTLDMSFEAEKVSIEPIGFKTISVEISEADSSSVLDHFTISDILDHFNEDEILDYIGRDRAIEYFDITEAN